MGEKIVIIGGVAAGPKAACHARRLMPDAEITILAESSKQSQSPLGYTAFIDWPKVEIKAEHNIHVYIDSKGVIKKL